MNITALPREQGPGRTDATGQGQGEEHVNKQASAREQVPGILFISEEESAGIISHELAFEAAREALVAATQPGFASFPTVIGHGSSETNRFTIKSAAAAEVAGLKVGSYWPGNDQKGLPRHNSTILIFDQDTGRIGAVIQGGLVNAYRTAAADAVAADALAREDATTLTIFGTGHQALYECAAVSRIRPISNINVVGRNPERTRSFIDALAGRGLAARPATAEEGCRSADIIVTATTSRTPLFESQWVQPGTHIASMGSDAPGKQELPTELFAGSRLFCDLPSQSAVIGEFQHLAGSGENLTAIGDVLSGTVPGRNKNSDITVFDSSGVALQDLYIGLAIVRAHLAPSAP